MTQYTETVITGMQMLYGDGFLSPGGPDEVPELLGDVSPADRHILDIGCGLGGLAVMLVRDFGAAHVTAVDIEADLIDHARSRIEREGLSDRVEARQVSPGPLPLEDEMFDMAVTKDVICHVPDKAAFLADIHRVLKPGGRLLIADFFDNSAESDEAAAALFEAYVNGMANYGLNFHFQPFSDYRDAIHATGLVLVEHRDHTATSAGAARREHNLLGGNGAGPIEKALGPQRFAARREATEMRMRALDARSLLHGHLLAEKTA